MNIERKIFWNANNWKKSVGLSAFVIWVSLSKLLLENNEPEKLKFLFLVRPGTGSFLKFQILIGGGFNWSMIRPCGYIFKRLISLNFLWFYTYLKIGFASLLYLNLNLRRIYFNETINKRNILLEEFGFRKFDGAVKVSIYVEIGE